MTASLGISKTRRRRSGGNAIIESAFTLLPTFAMIFFMTDMGLMLFRWSTLQNAVREGARYAITFAHTVNGVSTGQDAAIKAKVAEFAFNVVTTADVPAHIFVNYYLTTAPNTAIPTTSTASCGDAVVANRTGNCPGNIVEVSVQNIGFSWLAPLSGSFGAGVPFYRYNTALTLAVYSSDMMGAFPVNVTSVAR